MKISIARALVCLLAIVLVAGCGHSRVVKREGSRPAPERAAVKAAIDAAAPPLTARPS